MSRFKIGDVILNKWAGERNPLRKSIYIGDYFTVSFYGGRFHKSTFINMEEDTEHFLIIGHAPIVELYKVIIEKALEGKI